ncbi:MAG: ubiquinol-cytochrome C chaperone [Rhodospirillaceae bacterium]|nr:ubiquinol-cytochrome C chaperone [Rhodospirillaceae bacterium]MYB13775.1 ubiquinol-cytochrome C chaperone [Rhodospirillaceae bacterium]MYI50546.1 ubiquinol-cytochrome C chaperone [Rhodospirillaceae bacterium]
MTLLDRFSTIFDKDRRRNRASAGALYACIVAAARHEHFYRVRGVPDTLDGRFELLALHVVLVCRRLAAEGPAGAAAGQHLFDVMIEDLDMNLRELGVNDPSLGRRVKEMARAFYGRCGAYAAALDGGDRPALEGAVARNLYGTLDPAPANVTWAADYIEAVAGALDRLSLPAVAAADIRFPEPGS